MSLQAQFVDTSERFHDIDGEALANQHMFHVVSGCAPSYSASTMVITVAAGVILHNGARVTVAGNTVTAVQSGSAGQARWAIVGIDSSGTAQIAHGDAAANTALDPSLKPEFATDQVYVCALLIPQGTTVVDNATQKIDKRIPGYSAAPTIRYAAATQTFNASTTFVDLISPGSPATFSQAVAASEVWHITARLRVIYTGTGGLKLQFTGPAAPTAVRITGSYNIANLEGSLDTISNLVEPFPAATAFSSTFANAQAAAATANNYNTTDNNGWIAIDLFLVNGSTAGTVTLQGAQNGANGTSVIQIGSWLRAERVL